MIVWYGNVYFCVSVSKHFLHPSVHLKRLLQLNTASSLVVDFLDHCNCISLTPPGVDCCLAQTVACRHEAAAQRQFGGKTSPSGAGTTILPQPVFGFSAFLKF